MASTVITLNRSPEDMAANRMTFHIAKSRSSQTDWSVVARTDFGSCRTHSNDMGCWYYRGGELKPSATSECERAVAVGLAFQFAASARSHQGQPLAGFAALARSALQVGQMRVYVNPAHECVGYVVWATLTPDVERDYIAGKPRPLAEWEFSDGTSAWVLDFAVAPGLLPKVMADLRDVVFKDHDQLTYFRLKGQRRLCKRVSRSDGTSFMAAGRQQEVTA